MAVRANPCHFTTNKSNTMPIANTDNLVGRLTELDQSTSLFLESLNGNPLKVLIESQEEVLIQHHLLIRRTTKLFFESSDRPLLYCTSVLSKGMLSKREYHLLVEGILPIGILFMQCNDPSSIKKTNITVRKEVNRGIASSLNVESTLIFEKRYDYWVGDRQIGYICEFFNAESLSRV